MKKLITFLVIGFLLCSCESHNKKHKEQALKHLITKPLVIDTILTKDYVCQIHSIRNIELKALESGYLQNIFVDEGQAVKKGQSMFQIMPSLYQAELQKAQAEANMTQIEYNNTKLLANNNIVSSNELALAKAKYEKSMAEVNIAKTRLGFTNIQAPFDGIMDYLHVREGSLLEEGEILTTLSDNSKMWVYFNVPEAEYLNYAKNKKHQQHVQLLMANNQVFNHKGIIETIEAEFNNETGNIAFRATFPNPDGLLRHGETGSILIESPLKEALLIPQKSTFEILNKKYVYVLDKNYVVHQREITIEAEIPHVFIIKSGISSNDNILLNGIRQVKEGDHINFKYIDSKFALNTLELFAE